jgi:hypothetical protein
METGFGPLIADLMEAYSECDWLSYKMAIEDIRDHQKTGEMADGSQAEILAKPEFKFRNIKDTTAKNRHRFSFVFVRKTEGFMPRGGRIFYGVLGILAKNSGPKSALLFETREGSQLLDRHNETVNCTAEITWSSAQNMSVKEMMDYVKKYRDLEVEVQFCCQ